MRMDSVVRFHEALIRVNVPMRNFSFLKYRIAPCFLLFIDVNSAKPISAFLQELETYQSNHYGYYNRSSLVDAYNNLPIGIKKYLIPDPKRLKNLWRGCDGLSETRAVSFTQNKGIAHLFGAYVIPFKELESYEGLIDSERAHKLARRLSLDFGIGDDEGEVIVIQPKWNSNLESNLRQYFVG